MGPHNIYENNLFLKQLHKPLEKSKFTLKKIFFKLLNNLTSDKPLALSLSNLSGTLGFKTNDLKRFPPFCLSMIHKLTTSLYASLCVRLHPLLLISSEKRRKKNNVYRRKDIVS